MKLQIKETRHRMVVYTLTGLVALVFILAIGTGVAGAMAWHFAHTQKTLTVPMAFDQPFVSDVNGGDARLNGMLVRSLVNLRLNVTPETVDRQHALLLSWTSPAARSEMKKVLATEAAYVKKNGIASVYSIEDEATDPATGDVTVGGTLHASTTNGSVRIDLPDARQAWRLRLHYTDGLIRLEAFPEVSWPAIFNADNAGNTP